jgi:hypothetical protein
MIDRSICESFATTSSHLLVGGQVMELSFPLHKFWTMPLVTPLLSPSHSIISLLLSTIPSRAFAALFYFSLFPVSNDASYSSVLWRQGPRHTCSLARPDGWGAKGDESDGERGESRVISIQRPLYSGAALRSNAIKGPLYHTFLTVAWLVLPSRAG